MKIYLFIFVSLLITNGLLSIRAARLKCPSVEIANGSAKIRSKGRIIAYKCYRGFYLLGEPYAACIKGKWDSSPPICLRPGCTPIKTLLNGNIHESWRSALLKFTCNSGYELLGPSFIYCNGRKWNAMQPYCKAVEITCNFENKTTCNWEIDDYDDEDFNWRLQQYEPPSRALKTGPLHDHTLSPNKTGHYIVLETSDYTPSSRPARIHSPVFPKPSDNSSCFIFWYHMYGNTIGVLNVFLNNILVFQRQRNHGDRWIKGVIPLNNESINSAGDLQVIIEGSYGGGYTGDIGLDDFSLGNGTDCTSAKVTSCAGRCYEDHEDTSFCLCNPECFTDSSCCDDFEDVCRLESSTPLIEASTGLEDITQVYSVSDETTVTEYDTDSPKIFISTTPEYETVETLVHQDNTNFTTQRSVEDPYLLIGTQGKLEIFHSTTPKRYITTIPYTKENENTNTQVDGTGTTESVTHWLEEKKSLTQINESTTAVEGNSVSSVSYFHKEKDITAPVDNPTAITQIIPTIQQFAVHALGKSINSVYMDTPKFLIPDITPTKIKNKTTLKVDMKQLSKEANSLLKKTLPTVPNSKEIFTNRFTFVTVKPANNVSISSNKTENISKYPARTTVKMVPFTVFSTFAEKKDSTVGIVNIPNLFTSTLSPIQVDEKSKNIMFKFVTPDISSTPPIKINISTKFALFKNTSIGTTTDMLFRASSNSTFVKNQTYFFQNVTSPLSKLKKITSLMPNLINYTLSDEDRDKINGSHTHLRTTSQLPPIIYPTKKNISLNNSTKQSQHITVSPPKKWKSIYKPKDRFVFSAIQTNKGDGNNILTVLLICSGVLGAISVLLLIFFIKRKRFNFINEVEEADTDILYHSSQEMLDLHLARPNH